MTRVLVILLGFALTASIAWNVKTHQTLEAEKVQRSHQEEQIESLIAQVKSLESQLSQVKKQNQSQIGTELSRIADLKAKLAAQQELADRAKQRLEDAKSNARGVSDAGPLQERLRQEKRYIDELQAKLRQTHQQESQFSAQAKMLHDQQKWQEHQDQVTMAEKIRLQQVTVQGTIEKLKAYKGRKDYIGKVEQQKLQDELKAEKASLSQLKDQKHLLDQQWRDENSLSGTQTHQSQQELKTSDETLKQTLQQEQARYQAMQSSLSQAQKGQKTTQDEINRLEADYQQQIAKARDLETSLKNEQNALQQIAH